MTSKSRASRRAAARDRDQRRSPARWLLPGVGALIVLVAVVAVALTQGSPGAEASPTPSTVVTDPPTIAGDTLPTYVQTVGDSAKGAIAPEVAGHDYSGNPVGISPTGRPTLVIFAAHWCPHCQRELPLIQDWINAGRKPSGVDLVSVSTAIDPTAPNYPPETWLERVGWTVPLIVDPTGSVAKAYGLTEYPFFVLLDGQGKVVARLSGEIPMAGLESLLGAVPS